MGTSFTESPLRKEVISSRTDNPPSRGISRGVGGWGGRRIRRRLRGRRGGGGEDGVDAPVW
jgi:hypothetical protein